VTLASTGGYRIKLQRASQHIDELRVAAKAYLQSEPFGLEQHSEPNGDRVWLVRIKNEIPRIWSAVLGDAVHNLRASLDLLAWRLVEQSGGQPSRDTCFPIGKAAPPVYDQTLRRALAGASPRIHRFVSRLRPYVGGNKVLSQLHALDVTDKHRLVLVVGAAHKHLVLKMRMAVPWQTAPVEFPPIAINPADRQFPLADGVEVFRIQAAARDNDVGPEHQIVFELAFGDVAEVRGLPLVPTLDSMHGHVRRIVDMAERWFLSCERSK
jgi:hypothetical protein